MRTVFYIAVVIAMVLPLLFRRVYWLRVVCVLFLGFAASVHCVFLLGEHRLILERGLKEYGVPFGSKLPQDFLNAVKMVQELSHGQMAFVGLLFAAFVLLALVPFRNVEKRKDTEPS